MIFTYGTKFRKKEKKRVDLHKIENAVDTEKKEKRKNVLFTLYTQNKKTTIQHCFSAVSCSPQDSGQRQIRKMCFSKLQ